ncbi:unnamed protein product [Pleuronectes platessa]|uniref:Ig-like domain-containing protein n=1 Tax=Pleuronectes platessa TaxID=8262 RepID=A0A9N7V1R1_PLEPL|nr:unnamed protein product [Pleuronectes platessa]
MSMAESAAPPPVLTVSPSWLTPGASGTLTCGGVPHPTAGWRFYCYEMLPGSDGGTEQNSFVIQDLTESAGYSCRAGRGDPVFYTEYSNTKWVWSGDSGRVILESPVHPVTEGQSVTLSCSWFRRKLDSNISFYKNDELLQSDVRGKLEISAVSKSDEGFYKCERSGVFSPESWMSVTLTPAAPPSANSKNLCCDRLSQSLRTNQSSDPTVHYDEVQLPVYSSLLHGDDCIYESIRGDTEEGAGLGKSNGRGAAPRRPIAIATTACERSPASPKLTMRADAQPLDAGAWDDAGVLSQWRCQRSRTRTSRGGRLSIQCEQQRTVR